MSKPAEKKRRSPPYVRCPDAITAAVTTLRRKPRTVAVLGVMPMAASGVTTASATARALVWNCCGASAILAPGR